ncbi:hypothetical protein L249_5017 [Ophiocordyceps polyrhachis-furcata BCC 54312]|uniref:T6SS Phospholipase effector Tle1-like catalytic domain-containing protein n=1 Tax=Ophiocordyceps polyrhachis-furcata BCC 54312 TaxID=1330021 RepID=A0A367L3H9_9HYPO|nr:hypothetical protein L249_5017 [Ophiocordyceps polyrhachis-furcata BCC 54312]
MATLTTRSPLTAEGSSATLLGMDTSQPEPRPQPKKLVLFFDGTGNSFSGSTADTNVIKMMNKLARSDRHQLHYYQTGIGTYDIRNEGSVDKNWFSEKWSSLVQMLDQGFGTSFGAHLMAGYRFLMRYYNTGDKIYMFGFSRGAFVARFLARMLCTVGLLCKGNEEMVRFAYRLYRRFLDGEAGKGAVQDEVDAFSRTFCRREPVPGGKGKKADDNVRVYFLGIWDCVNSVAVLERNAPLAQTVYGTADHVRHAVAVDERRVKFRAALLAQDVRVAASNDDCKDDIREVWFPGCHGDVGGGWPAEKAADSGGLDDSDKGIGKRFRRILRTRRSFGTSPDAGHDDFQMSDVPLAWMMRELDEVAKLDQSAGLKFGPSAQGFHSRYTKNKEQTRLSVLHDSLRFGHGTGFFRVLLWRFLEWLPFVSRRELVNNKWVDKRFPPNFGSTRDIPRDAVLHESLVHRLKTNRSYKPPNNHGDDLQPCLKVDGKAVEFELVGNCHPEHPTYIFRRKTQTNGQTNGQTTNGH